MKAYLMTTDQLRQEVLAPIYDMAGFSDYTLTYTPQIIQFLHQHDWLGRQILDMGCGTGVATEIFCQLNMAVTAVDSSPAMLAKAQERLNNTPYDVTFVHETLKNFTPVEQHYDLAFCLDVVNHIQTPADVEVIFQKTFRGLQSGKLFVFDLQTLRGLSQNSAAQHNEVLYNNESLYIVANNTFDYDAYSLRRYYTIFQRQASRQFSRSETLEILRGYPYRAIKGMLERVGFQVKYKLSLSFQLLDETSDPDGRIIIVAEKP